MALADALSDKLESAKQKKSTGSSKGKNKYFRFEDVESKALYFALQDLCASEIGESGTTQAVIPVWFYNKLDQIASGDDDQDLEEFVSAIDEKMEEHAERLED